MALSPYAGFLKVDFMRPMVKSLIVAATVAACGSWAQTSFASPLIYDNFDASTGQGNWPGDSVFISIPQPGNVPGLPSVDLVGPTYFDNLAYSTGSSVDLDGSTGTGNHPAGELQSTFSLPVGNYVVTFLLAGNLRGATPQTTVIAIGSSSQDLTPPSSQPYTLETLYFTDVSGYLTFTERGPSDQQGNLLDNVSVSATPLPSTWMMLIGGVVGFGFLAYRGKKKGSAALATA